MDKTFNISVRDRLAKNLSHLDYVCGNTGYMVRFDFDEEWDAYPIKTARFIESSGEHHDVAVTDNQCEFPQIMNTIRVEVGVYAGELYTTTPAVIGARRSILSTGGDRPAVPEKNEYDKMMEAINQDAVRAENAADEAETAAEEAKKAAEKAVGGGIVVVQITRENGVMKSSHTFRELQDLREKKVLLAMEGARTYTYFGQEEMNLVFANVDYSGGQNNKSLHAMRLVISSDDTVAVYSHNNVKAPNPKKIKFTGAVSAEYDGSSPVTVNIPAGGDGNGTGLPTGGEPHQMLVTDADGVAKWEERTHYTVAEEVTVLPEGVYTVNPDMGAILFPEPLSPSLVDGGRYTVVIEGETFNSTAAALTFDGMDIVLIGNPSFIGAGADNGEPYMMLVFVDENIASAIGGYGMFMCAIDATSVTLKVTGNAETVKKIPEKFIPAPKNGFILNGSQIGSLRTLLSEVEGEDYTIGYSAFAEGESTRASGCSSHAEGLNTVASGNESHAEGTNTIAGGLSSHTEGDGTTASGGASHAEGGSTTASGWMAHAEGYQTEASGYRSHAEGRNTIANGSEQHVQGKYNVEDTANKYAHIVGNGTADNKRSNAHTIDWDGNGWFAGTVEGTALILPDTATGKRYKITVADGKLTMEEVQ